MKTVFPLSFTLDSGTHVDVNSTGDNTYNFALRTEDGVADNFTYVEDGRSKDEVEATLDFDQLNALRAFWLKMEEVG